MRIIAGLCLGMLWAVGAAADIAGSADHPAIPRYEGAEIYAYQTQAYTDWRFFRAPATVYGGLQKNLDATETLEGKLTRLSYRAPAERTPLEVFRNYQQALSEAGFETLYSCEREDCGGRNFNHAITLDMHFREYHQDQRYLYARLPRPEGDLYAALYVVLNQSGGGPNKGRSLIQLDVLERKAMEQRMVLVEAGELQRGLDAQGRVALYGLYFDTDKADMRADSQPQLAEIAKLLQASAQLQVLVVGHTDAQGALDYNRDLSQRRAQSIVEALVSQHGIARQRLSAVGVGMAAPVASNRDEAGRALNRRVELVQRLP